MKPIISIGQVWRKPLERGTWRVDSFQRINDEKFAVLFGGPDDVRRMVTPSDLRRLYVRKEN